MFSKGMFILQFFIPSIERHTATSNATYKSVQNTVYYTLSNVYSISFKDNVPWPYKNIAIPNNGNCKCMEVCNENNSTCCSHYIFQYRE